jgi:hypothetical protein
MQALNPSWSKINLGAHNITQPSPFYLLQLISFPIQANQKFYIFALTK